VTLNIDYGLCVGCGACAEVYPMLFTIRDEKAWVIDYTLFRFEVHKDVPTVFPFRDISIE
jgi:ferredoxin